MNILLWFVQYTYTIHKQFQANQHIISTCLSRVEWLDNNLLVICVVIIWVTQKVTLNIRVYSSLLSALPPLQEYLPIVVAVYCCWSREVLKRFLLESTHGCVMGLKPLDLECGLVSRANWKFMYIPNHGICAWRYTSKIDVLSEVKLVLVITFGF